MANQPLLTYGSKLFSVEQLYFSPSVTVPVTGGSLSSLYCFLASVDPWDNDATPPVPTQDQKSLKKVLKNIFVAKHITTSDISPVIARRDWQANTIYTSYSDDIDMFQNDANGLPLLNYYVRNRYDQIFKCLWNNNGTQSLDEPYFQPGSYGTNNIFEGGDGYKWKYIYTIDSGSKIKFMDTAWMPVPANLSTINPLLSAAGTGNIDAINLTSGGSGYDPANSIISVTVTGDGTGATALAETANGSISNIIVQSPGQNYTYANVSITSSSGSGAIALAPVSPIGGHGNDPMSELGCNHVMITSQFNESENGNVPTDIKYYQIGILANPVSIQNPNNIANSSIYKTSTSITVASGFGLYTSGEIIYQGESAFTPTFIGKILSFDPASDVITVINTKGTITVNAPIFGDTSKTTRTLLSSTEPDFITLSGYVYYLENRSGIQRSVDGIEQFKVVLRF